MRVVSSQTHPLPSPPVPTVSEPHHLPPVADLSMARWPQKTIWSATVPRFSVIAFMYYLLCSPFRNKAIENFSLSLNSSLDGWSSLRCQPTRSYQDLAPLSGFISNWSCTSSNRRQWKRIKRDILTHYPEPGITRPPIAIAHICPSAACCSLCSARR